MGKKIIISISFALIVVLFGGFYTGYSCACTWNGDTLTPKWENPKNIVYINNVSSNQSRLKSLVNNAALSNWNNSQSTIKLVKGDSIPSKYISVEDVNLSSVNWTGIA